MTQFTLPLRFFPAFCSFLFFFFTILNALAQESVDKCGTVFFNNKILQRQGAEPEAKKSRFEEWIKSKQLEKQNSQLRTLGEQQDLEVLRIPVVVHIIHRGEALGEGTNIPFEQIEDQIRVLNEDFRRQNIDTVATLPIFQSVAADPMIEFVLAQQTPDGFETDGVTRTEGDQLSYGITSAAALSSLSYWPAEDYFNIWVVPLRNGYLGYAQFPESDLEGLPSSENRTTDGVVIDYRYFGSTGNAVSNSLGRTTTHEVGHFLGLRHIWGDGDCSVDDYVDDTPLQSGENEDCPTAPESCGSLDMYQNYMDYTADVCMNLFTQGQTERMRIVLLNSPRRASLLISPALNPPQVADVDAGIEQILAPLQSACESQLTPSIEVTNEGANTINTINVQLFLQGNFVSEQQANTTLESGESTQIDFSSLNLGPSVNPYEIVFQITQVNGEEDDNTLNNDRSVNFIVPQSASLPLNEDFEVIDNTSLLNIGIIQNDDDQTTWSLINVPGFDGQDNQALYLNYYNYENGLGESDYLYTPVYDLSALREAELSFRYAYAPYEEDNEVREDLLMVGISIDCGATIEEVLFEASGEDLATVPLNSAEYAPDSRADWRQLRFSLDEYIGEQNVQLVFMGTNAYGNNLYLDDIQLNSIEENELDLAITNVQSPAYLSCASSQIPLVEITNKGTTSVSRFEVSYQLDNEAPTDFEYNGIPLNPGESRAFTFEELDLSVGLHTFTVNISEPNLGVDEQAADNQIIHQFYVDDKVDVVPLKQNFESNNNLADFLSGETANEENAWQVINPDAEIGWELASLDTTGNNASAFINLYEYQNIGALDLLVSPKLDLSAVTEFSVFFNVSYAQLSESYTDTLRLKVSTDCGQTYETAYEKAGADLAITTSTDAWAPQGDADWIQEFVNLSAYVGMPEVRVAFEVVNAYGNNLYLDEIEFYLSEDEEPVARNLEENTYRVYPNPYHATASVDNDGLLKMAFNLKERDDITIIMYDSQGRLVSDRVFPYTLNQTYEFDLDILPTGMYIIKVLGNTINTTNKLLKQ